MTGNEESFRIEIPEPVRSDIINSIESDEFLDWFYPKTEDETLEEYIENRRGQFDGIGFTIFPDQDPVPVNYESPVNTPPEELQEKIEDTRRPVYREEYTIRFDFASKSWDTVEDVWVDVYRIIEEPADMI